MTDVVAGGAGFLGSHLVNALVDDGRSVIVIDNLSTGHIRNLERAISSGAATFIYADVAVPSPVLAELLANATKEPVRRVFHLAAPAKPNFSNGTAWEMLEASALGTMSLIEIALANEAPFLFASSAAVYDSPLVQPPSVGISGITDAKNPRRSYEEGKRFGEALVTTAIHTRGLDGRIIRLYDCYGPTMADWNKPLVLELFRAALAGEPFPIGGIESAACSLTYAKDAIALTRLVAGPRRPTFAPVDVGNDVEVSVHQIARTIAQIAGVEFNVSQATDIEAATRLLKPDLTVARSYGWSASTSLGDGLETTFAWLRNERVAFA